MALAACSLDLFDPLGKASYPYAVLTPKGYDNISQSVPVLVFLHGSEGLPSNYISEFALHSSDFPFLLVTPKSEFTWEADRLNNLLDEIKDKYRVDTKRVYVTGFSMGAHGAFEWAADSPSKIAAAVMIAGAGPAQAGCEIKDVPAWFIHNRNDPVVPTSETERTVAELKNCGAQPMVTINEEPGFIGTHDAWTSAYANSQLYSWLLQHTK